MKIVTVSNYFNHHQKPLSDELYELTNGNYWFVATEVVPAFRIKLGYVEPTAPYVLYYYKENKIIIDKLILDADVVVFGEAPIYMLKQRAKQGKLFFRDDERRYKTISRYLKWPIYTYHSFTFNKGYLLCASAFAAKDYWLSGMPLRKCYRWGYFPLAKQYGDISDILDRKSKSSIDRSVVSILWVGRLISLKHPEMPIKVARILKDEGIRFKLTIIGTGKLNDFIKKSIKKWDLDNVVEMMGAMPSDMVREYMEEADIFLFTSGRHEGWGAVLNESMNSACAVVASDAIGSVPFLVKNNHNGLVFKNGCIKDLYRKVKYLIDNPNDLRRMQREAYYTIVDSWSPNNAAKSLVLLAQSIAAGEPNPIQNGPCSQAPMILDKWL